MIPSPTWLLPGIYHLNLLMLVFNVPFPPQRLGGKCDFYRHLHSVLESNNKQIVNFGIFSLSSPYHIYEMRVHSSYAYICGTTERGIILTDCQLLCLWKLVLFVHDLELLVSAWRATAWPDIPYLLTSSHHQLLQPLSSQGRESSDIFSFDTSLWNDDLCDILCMAFW